MWNMTDNYFKFNNTLIFSQFNTIYIYVDPSTKEKVGDTILTWQADLLRLCKIYIQNIGISYASCSTISYNVLFHCQTRDERETNLTLQNNNVY